LNLESGRFFLEYKCPAHTHCSTPGHLSWREQRHPTVTQKWQ
jgi:hypothetical protein